MLFGRLLTSILPLLVLCAGGSIVLAQGAGPWVDPPAENGATPQPPAPQSQAAPTPQPPAPPVPEMREATQPRQTEPRAKTAEPPQNQRATRAGTAKNFAIDYLASWSARNDVALGATAELYAPRVLFHGRTISLERLYREKQRFIRRWPEREYRPRQDAIGIECNPGGTVCTVHAVFDYRAVNPRHSRVSQGSGALQLIVEFIGDKPVIVAEHSTLLNQTRKRNLALEGTSNE